MGALADEYEYLMQSSYEKGEMSAREEFVTYWVDEVVRSVRTKGMSVDEAIEDVHVRPEYVPQVSERSRAVLDRD